MSWSFSQKGKPSEVAAAAAATYAASAANFGEPEKTIVAGVAAVVAATLGAMPDTASVDLSSYGSQSPYAAPGTTAEDACNQVTLSITYDRTPPTPAAQPSPTATETGQA